MQQSSFTRNLVIVQSVPEQQPSDWIAIKQAIERNAPDIEVRIADNRYRSSAIEVGEAGIASHRQRNAATAIWQIQRPSLVFSPVHLLDYVPRGGALYCGHVMGKDEQLRRLSSIGISTPRTATFSPDSSFSRKEWGKYVIVKPNNLNAGKGIKLVRTIDLAARYDELTAIVDDQFLVQQYIDLTEDGYPVEYRVLTLFGRALYCIRNRWHNKHPPLAEIAADPVGIIAWNTSGLDGVPALGLQRSGDRCTRRARSPGIPRMPRDRRRYYQGKPKRTALCAGGQPSRRRLALVIAIYEEDGSGISPTTLCPIQCAGSRCRPVDPENPQRGLLRKVSSNASY